MPLRVKIQLRKVNIWSRGGDGVTVTVMLSAGSGMRLAQGHADANLIRDAGKTLSTV